MPHQEVFVEPSAAGGTPQPARSMVWACGPWMHSYSSSATAPFPGHRQMPQAWKQREYLMPCSALSSISLGQEKVVLGRAGARQRPPRSREAGSYAGLGTVPGKYHVSGTRVPQQHP